MSSQASPLSQPRTRDKTLPSPLALLGALAAGPAAWSVQLIVSYGVASHACFPRRTPWLATPPPGWAGESAWLTFLNLACLAAALAAAVVSRRRLRRLRSGGLPDLQSAAAIGRERAKFLATCGLLAGVGFSIGILFDTLEPHLIASCWRIAQ